MFARNKTVNKMLGGIREGKLKGTILFEGYSDVRNDIRRIYNASLKLTEYSIDKLFWLNDKLAEPTGISIIDETFNAIRENPAYKGVLNEVDSFYYNLEEIGRTGEDIDNLVKGTFNYFDVPESEENPEKLISPSQVLVALISKEEDEKKYDNTGAYIAPPSVPPPSSTPHRDKPPKKPSHGPRKPVKKIGSVTPPVYVPKVSQLMPSRGDKREDTLERLTHLVEGIGKVGMAVSRFL